MKLPQISYDGKLFLVNELDRKIAQMVEVDTKRVGGRTHDRGDFLVVEDPEKVTTWHLPVKIQGAPNRRLAAAAWAALFSARGYRGNKYDGPKKDEAKRKLRALYKSEDWEEPPMSEMDYPHEPEAVSYVPYGVQSFDDLDAAEAANEATRRVRELAWQFQQLVGNILGDPSVSVKAVALQGLADEFVSRVAEALGEDMTQDLGTGEVQPSFEGGIVEELAESTTGHALRLRESDNGTNRRGPLDLDIVIIKPGFGNKRDNHYYTAAMLEAHAGAFVGAKMYSTDHRDSEKSVRTEVSRIKEIVGFSEGAPVGRVTVFDPDFAESVRNRADAGELESLECSILASGVARNGEVEGRKAKIVESITEVSSVDWVTKAGAGGHALRLSESEATMEPEKEENGLEETELEEVIIEEGQEGDPPVDTPTEEPEEGKPETDEPEADEPEPEPAETTEAEPVPLSEAEVGALIPDHLPAETRERLLSQSYFNEQDARKAVTVEIDYLRAVTGSGKPFGNTGPSQPQRVTAKEIEKRLDAVNAKWMGVRLREKEASNA